MREMKKQELMDVNGGGIKGSYCDDDGCWLVYDDGHREPLKVEVTVAAKR